MRELAPPPPTDGTQPCNQVDPETFFGDLDRYDLIAEAKRICRRCPFITACRAYALDRPDVVGVWGGTSEAERRGLRPVGVIHGQQARARARRERLAQLDNGALSTLELAEILGCDERTVTRDRRALEAARMAERQRLTEQITEGAAA